MQNVTTLVLQKGINDNFEFPRIVMISSMTSSEYKLAAEYIFK